MRIWDRRRRYTRQDTNFKNGYRKTTVVEKRSKRLYTGFMKTAVNTNSHMSELKYNRWQ